MRTSTLHSTALSILQKLTGQPDAQFRDGQWEAISALLEQRAKVLVVQRTGWGKSAVYFVTTALTRSQGAGPTILLSPLLSLMRDQIDAAARAGIRAVSMNSSNAHEWSGVHQALQNDDVDVLLISPERLNNPTFRDEQLPLLLARCGLLVVDEAHCISDWGHDFRPDYRRIAAMLTELPTDLPVLATTATANRRVAADVQEQLSVNGAQVLTLRGGLARASLRLAVLDLPDDQTRLAWLISNLADLPGSGIIYTLSVSAAQDTATALRAAGYDVQDYTDRTDNTERQEREHALRHNQLKALVATSALGMGFDKPDVGFVVHLGAPSSPVTYYQQVGRAGRATASADVILLPTTAQKDIWQYFATASMPEEQECLRTLAALEAASGPLSVAKLETFAECNRSRLEVMLKTLAVDGAALRVKGGWVGTGQAWSYDHDRYARVAAARSAEEDAMLAYQNLSTCRMMYLQEALDDHHRTPCGRCDNCAGPWLPTHISAAATNAAHHQLQHVGVPIEPRKMWPTGMANLGINVSGRIPATEQNSPGRALARFSDLGLGPALATLVGPDTISPPEPKPTPHWVLDACVRVLKDWDWAQRPQHMVILPDAKHRSLLTDIAQNLCRVGQLNYAGELHDTRFGDVSANVNSAYQLQHAWERYQVPHAVLQQLTNNPAPVLLLAATMNSGWQLTTAGRALRTCGVPAVLPLVLGQRQ